MTLLLLLMIMMTMVMMTMVMMAIHPTSLSHICGVNSRREMGYSSISIIIGRCLHRAVGGAFSWSS